MPELPEVEIAARHLRAWAIGRRIEAVDAEPAARRIFRPDSPAKLKVLVGRRVVSIRRIGKNLLWSLDGKPVLGVHSHLGMTGKWLRRRADDPPPRFSCLRLHVDDGRVLHYVDLRRFGRFRPVPGARFDELPELRGLGPDPLEDGIDVDRLHRLLSRSRRPVKLLLLDQAILPGVGNILASEALWRAKADPRCPGSSLSRAECRRLADGVLAAVRETIEREDPPELRDTGDITYVEEPGADNPFRVYAREGERCPRCRKATIQRIVIGGRSTYFCPRCQK